MERTIYLVSIKAADGSIKERLVESGGKREARDHVTVVDVATAADVARILGAGGKVEMAS